LAFLDVDLSNKTITLCGNYGDPIYHPDFVNFVKQLKETGVSLSIITNGSYKTKNWWQELTDLLTHNDKIIFSIDGIPENFTQYRKNADWKSIQLGIETSVASQCQVGWSYIPFSFNETTIDQARELSVQLGIDTFIVNPSDRYDDRTIHLIPKSDNLLGTRFESQQNWKNDKSTVGLDPKCNKNNQHFISAEGFYSPCCFLADHRFYYKNQFGKDKKQYNILTTTLSELLERPNVIEFYNTMEQHSGCQYNCPKTAV
jgi:MoaA/NifB/PqqE/SkfB family radical SAM enzyme